MSYNQEEISKILNDRYPANYYDEVIYGGPNTKEEEIIKNMFNRNERVQLYYILAEETTIMSLQIDTVMTSFM